MTGLALGVAALGNREMKLGYSREINARASGAQAQAQGSCQSEFPVALHSSLAGK